MMSFGNKKLDVYQVGLEFVSYRADLQRRIKRSINACDHLQRAGESIPLNIAHAYSSENDKERGNYLGYANGSALECAACLDVLMTWDLITHQSMINGKRLLSRLVSMLVASKKKTNGRICEPKAFYQAEIPRYFFDHEKLYVYQSTLQFIAWMRQNRQAFSGSQDLMVKFDKSSTAILLNIAEGNGRFTNPDKAKFFKIARKATTQTSALLDIALGDQAIKSDAQEILQSTGKLLSGLIRSKST